MGNALQRKRIDEFIASWKDRGHEKQETQSFWRELLATLFDWNPQEVTSRVEFEHPVNGGYIDVLCPDARLLVEQKGRDIDLDKPEPRRGLNVTPVEQALRYANELPASQKPRFLCTCNFQEFRFYDLDNSPTASKTFVDFPLTRLGERTDVFTQIFARENSRVYIQEQASRKAGILVAKLHNALADQYTDPDDKKSHRALAVLTVRLVFCLYAEDAGLFGHPGAFTDYVAGNDTRHLRRAIIDLLDVLDTPPDKRDPYLDPDGFVFAIIESSMFITWQKGVGGRLKSDCNFSNTVVWNSLPLPAVDDKLRERIVKAGREVEQARANHPGESLASLYNPLGMHSDPIHAHENLDRVVDLAFGAAKPCATNSERLGILFDRYAELTAAGREKR